MDKRNLDWDDSRLYAARSDHNTDADKDGSIDVPLRTVDDPGVWDDNGMTDLGRDKTWLAAQYQAELAKVNELRSALSAAKFERDIWWPLAFLVGTICGYGVSYVW